jgi:4-hydroxy-2-oxoheptanedioate aldolase
MTMRKNAVLETLRNGGEVVTGWLATNSTLNAELFTNRGFDAVTVDMQHGVADYNDLVPMLQAISAGAATPLVRTPWNDPAIIGRILDAGAYGIICPMVNTAEEADNFVQASRYFPKGRRSVGPIRASLYGGADYFAHANEEIMTLAMIESKEAVDNLDAILDTPNLDGIFVGPSDLAVSMGYKPGFDPAFPEVHEAVELIVARCKEKGKIAGTHCGSVVYGQKMRELGYQFMAYLSDFRMLEGFAAPALKAFKSGKPVDGIA